MNPDDQPENASNQPTQPAANYGVAQPSSQIPQTPQSTSYDSLAYNTPMSPPSKSKKSAYIMGTALLIVLLIAGAAYAAMRPNKTSPKSSNTVDTSASSERQPANQATEQAADAKQTETAINKVVATDLGKTTTVTKLIRNFSDEDLESNEEGVLVEVRVESDGTYTSVAGKSSYRLIGDDGKETRTAYLITDTDMSKAGFTPLASTSLKKGQPVTGYLAFAISKGSKKLTFRYHRTETKILGGQTLPAKDFDLVIAQ
jgi:hypothetical protein